jgi:hypothetical protein
VIGVPNADTSDAKLYVYAFSILAGTVIQVLLPLPWLRGKDGKLELVLDWRDPAVLQVFKLMLPVTLGLGLININALIDGVIAAHLIDANIAPGGDRRGFPDLHAAAGDVLGRDRDRSVSVALTVRLPPRHPGLPRHGLARRRARSRSCSCRRASSRSSWPSRSRGSSTSAARSRPTRRRSSRRPRRLRRRAHVQRDDADAEPRVLQPAVELAADRRRAREPLPERRARRRVLAGRDVGDRALDLARQPRRVGRALRPLRRTIGRVGFSDIWRSFVRILAAGSLAGATAFGVWTAIDAAVGRSLGGQLVSVLPAVAAAVAVYFGACFAFRVREMQALLSLRGRLRRA